jgi:hypothetical protein
LELVVLAVILAAAFSLRMGSLLEVPGLPGHDPIVHLTWSYRILETGHLESTYPPMLHTLIVSIVYSLGVQSFSLVYVLRFVISFVSAFSALPTFLFVRRHLGSASAGLVASLFVALSCRDVELISWGGYGIVLALLLVVSLFFTLFLELGSAVERTCIHALFVVAAALSHHFTTLILVQLLLIYLLVRLFRRGRIVSVEVFAALLLGLVAAALIWYNRFRLMYAYPLFEIILNPESFVFQPAPLDVYPDLFGGVPVVLSLLGLLALFYMLRGAGSRFWPVVYVAFWSLVPTLQFEGQLFGQYSTRFPYFMTYPMAILVGVVVLVFARLLYSARLVFFKGWVGERFQRLGRVAFLPVVVAVLVGSTLPQSLYVTDFASEAVGYYNHFSLQHWGAMTWGGELLPGSSGVLITDPPGNWVYLLGEEKPEVVPDLDPVDQRIQNRLMRVSSGAVLEGSAKVDVGAFLGSAWVDAVHLIDGGTEVSCSANGTYVHRVLSDLYLRKIFWVMRFPDEGQLVAEYEDRNMRVVRVLTVRGGRAPVELAYSVFSYVNLTEVSVNLNVRMDGGFYFSGLLVPSVIYWENPWDRVSPAEAVGARVTMETPGSSLGSNYTALFDPRSKTLLNLIYPGIWPRLISVEAALDRRIDNIRLSYEVGSIPRGRESGFSLLFFLWRLGSDVAGEDLTGASIRDLIRRSFVGDVYTWDYRDLMKTRVVSYVIGDRSRLPHGFSGDPDYDLIYNNGGVVVYVYRAPS